MSQEILAHFWLLATLLLDLMVCMFRFETAGESHGECLVATVTGMPAGIPISLAAIDRELWRRQQGFGRGGRMKIETDRAHIVSGVRHSKTIGSPIAIIIENKDWKNWTEALPVEENEGAATRKSRSRVRGPGMPIWPARSSTIFMTRATFWNGPARGRPRLAWRGRAGEGAARGVGNQRSEPRDRVGAERLHRAANGKNWSS